MREKESLIQSVAKDLEFLEDKYDRKGNKGIESNHNSEAVFRNGVHLVEKLYEKIEWLEKEARTKDGSIDKQLHEIESLKGQMECYLEEYGRVVKQSEDYEERLLSELRRLEEVIHRLKR